MKSNERISTVDIKQKVDFYLSYWKWILLSLVIALSIGFTYLRYAKEQYKATMVIKIKEEEEAAKLPSIDQLKSEGLFASGSDKIKDEIQVLQSRRLNENVIKNLGLNISCYEQGRIKEKELYKKSPIKVNFFANDSVISKIKTNLFIKVISDNEFILFDNDGKTFGERDDSEGEKYSFGEKIETGYGGIVLTPSVGNYKPKPGSNLRINISPVASLIKSYQSSLAISTQKGSSVLNLEMLLPVREKAVDYLNELVLEYNEDALIDKEEVVKITSDFIDNRLQRVSKELEEVDYTAEQLQKDKNLTNLNSQQNLNLQSKRQLEDEISNAANNIQLISYLEEELDKENKTSDMLPADLGIGDSNTSQIIKSHNELVAQRNRLLRTSSERNPVIINLNDQINALKQNLSSSLQNMKQSTQLTLNNLNNERNRISGQLYAAPTKAREFRDIKRQQDIKESLYLYLLQRREESAIKLGMYTPIAKVVDYAYASSIPVAPNHMIVYLASFIFGLTIPLGVIYAIDLLDTKIYTKDDLQRITDIPYIGDIPKTSKKSKLISKVDYSPKAEAFRILRSNIDFKLSSLKEGTKKLFITSTRAQEGKSHTSTNLASSISFSDKKVLLIEMDIRVPKILDYLEIETSKKIGLSDYIADKSVKPQDIVVKHPENKNLDIIPSGTIPPNPSELLMSDRVPELFNYFENKYDYIVVDTSAVGIVSDTLLISKFADMFIYVVSADGIDKRLLKHVAQPLYDQNRLPNMTLLLNGTKTGKKGYGYGYGYGYGNSPGKKKKWYQFR
ncbi:GumC family protein [uncultured Winogradskyella sp.]|uniref:GumC family protein n=1 Tax=uncultured Winogradskyella sp. TaxID=395353 RepID=UPI003518F59E